MAFSFNPYGGMDYAGRQMFAAAAILITAKIL